MTFITGYSSERARSDYINEETDALNALDSHDLPNADLETDCQTLAKLLSAGKGFSKDPFWELSANGLISGILAYIASCERSKNGISED